MVSFEPSRLTLPIPTTVKRWSRRLGRLWRSGRPRQQRGHWRRRPSSGGGAGAAAKILEANVFGLIETTRVCLPLLRAGNRPAVVNFESRRRRGIPGRSQLLGRPRSRRAGFSEALRAELWKDDVDVLVVNPA